MPDSPIGERSDLLFEILGRGIAKSVERVPAAEFDLTQLRMLERIPGDVSLAFQFVIRPGQHLQVVLDGMLAVPLDKLALFDARMNLRRPDFARPREDAQMAVHPVVKDARDYLFGMVAEVVIHADRRVARQFGSLRADLLERPQILGWQLIVGLR